MEQHRNYIAGEWVGSDEVVVNRNPSDLDDVVGEYCLADTVQTNQAIDAAAEAFPAWAASTPQFRFEVLDRIGGALLAARDHLGRTLAREQGKTLAAATFEVERAAYTFKFFAGETLRIPGERINSLRPGVEIEVTREPLGVVGLITPWNFPIGIPVWKLAPALAYGNCVVFKPPELVPGTSWEMAKIIHEAGLPAGVFNLVMGKGRVVGEALLASLQVNGISFTGSQGVGRRIAAQALATGKKVQLEMGGKNPLVVLDDADLDVAVEAAVDGAFFFTGQRCTASSRLIVTDGIHDRFVDALKTRMAQLRVGHALDPDTMIGPVVSEEQLQQDLSYIELGREEGAELTGGEQLQRETRGYFLAPALFTGTHNDMRINREEIFGPVASVIRVRDFDEALAVANATEFGLASSICTTSQKYASHFKRHSQAGLVMVNLPTAGFEYHVPFGGSKGSSYGPREQGRYAQEFYTTVKTAYGRPL
ncbi:aldehyde dehydrogenase family protein [Halomonas ramblicola]|uniref:aldehyde dehydrogenase family protein n=1 Tax=Halomonas ramblicola TaxID=747349 RepID=UPI0025B48693|nr:aldehyde dehydrogenase family protein [Halomonas ramblicola]MDN3522004.1 aldehyde dehydrogenase family protein [Halomonas ramblicola]